ncbi:hypothetical protein ANO14919_143710 [Xylariales sp. No.14919]|nr:hypothetical protein ANO14919_143710 [Xylariales sp. No.14919]
MVDSVMDSPKLASERSDIPWPRRVMTTPVPASMSLQRSTSPASSTSQADSSKSEDLVETLYSHPEVRIISFTSTRYDLPVRSNSDAPAGTLPPSSRLERTIAVGAFRIYRAPGSVAFLSCGSALQPILPKSQCWCINEDNSRFVLQIRRPQYWRIEVPVAHPDDALRALVLRDVFDKILLFEKTECPFERSFTVQLPDPPETPVKKKAWTAEGKNLISSPFQSDLSPPAHAPKAISRGKRTTSITRRFSLPSIEAIEDDEALDECHSGEKDELCGRVVSTSKVYEGFNTPSSTSPARYHAPPSREEDSHLVGPLKPTVAIPPASAANVEQDPTVISVPSSPSTDTEALQHPVIRTPGVGSVGIEVLPEKTDAHSLENSRPDPPNEQSAVEGNDACGSRSSHYLNQREDHVSTGASQAENESGTEIQHAQELHGPIRVADDDTTANQPVVTIAEAQQEYSLSEQKGDGVLKSDDSDDEDNPASFEGSGRVAPVNLARKRMTRVLAGRSFTAPPQLTLVTPTPSKPNEQAAAKKVSSPQPPPTLARGHSPSASTDSFHSVQSWHSSVTPPPEASRPDSPHTGDFSSEAESVHLPAPISESTYFPDNATTPKDTLNVIVGSPVVSDNGGSAEPTPRPTRFIFDTESREPVNGESGPRASRLSTFEDKLRTRRRSHAGNLSISRRALSPLPPAANLFSPAPRQTSQSRLAAVRRLPAAIIQKTIEILLSPPSHLVNLMLRVAAKILAGEWRGLVFGFGEAGEEIPVQWDYYSDGDFSDLSDSDDYTLTTRGANCGDSVPRTDLRRRTRWAHDDDDNDDGCDVD